VDVFMLYPNFRGMLFDDGPATMKFDVTVTPPAVISPATRLPAGSGRDDRPGADDEGLPRRRQLHGRDGRRADADRQAVLVSFDLVDLSTNGVVSTYPAYRVSRVAAGLRAAMKITFDEKNRVLMNGVPRFLLGVYDSGSGYSTNDSFWENQLWSATGERRMDNMKINMYLNYGTGRRRSTP